MTVHNQGGLASNWNTLCQAKWLRFSPLVDKLMRLIRKCGCADEGESAQKRELLPKPGMTLQGQLNTAKCEPGLDEVKNPAGMNHALRNPRLVEFTMAPKA